MLKQPRPSPTPQPETTSADTPAEQDASELGAEMFANRLKKNLKKLSNWAKQNHITCYRVYDADLPEYAVAVDIYQGEACRSQLTPLATSL